MEAVSPYKSDIGNSKKTDHNFISGFSFQSSNFQEKGGSRASPPFLSHLYRPLSLQQPPPLPLPAANHHRRAAARRFSSPSDNRRIYKNTRTRDSRTLNPKKARSSNYTGKERKPSDSTTVSLCDRFSGSVTFANSPPPSSVPLPTFSSRHLSCMSEACGIDTGATDNLLRLLRIR